MSRLRAPRLAGVAGGVGTSTLAAALRGYDRGLAADTGVDVLVCRSTGHSLHAAATVLAWLAGAGDPPPVLAVTADVPAPIRGPVRARLRMIEPQVSGLVLVPYLPHWRELTDPFSEVARLSEYPVDALPRPLRGYGEAIARLAEAVLDSGLLRRCDDPGVPSHRADAVPLADTVPLADLPTSPNRAIGPPDPGPVDVLPGGVRCSPIA